MYKLTRKMLMPSFCLVPHLALTIRQHCVECIPLSRQAIVNKTIFNANLSSMGHKTHTLDIKIDLPSDRLESTG